MLKNNELKISDKLKRGFIKDFKLPIQNIEEHFEYYVDLLDPYYDSKNKLFLFKDMLSIAKKEHSNIEEWFYNYSRNITQSIISDISKTESYQDFIKMDLSKYNIQANNNKKSSLYIKDNVGKIFCSIDLKKANYQALKLISKNNVLNTESYEDLVSKYTDFEYFKKSKQIRQVIFGNLNPKRQQKIQKYIMSSISSFLMDQGLPEESIISCSSDEICFELRCLKDVLYIMDNRKIMTEIPFHVELFELREVSEDRTFYYKDFINNKKIEFKAIPSEYICECIKHVEGNDVNYKDKLFLREGRICQFNDNLF